MENIEVLRKFFKAFIKKDVENMLECYHKKVVFIDPVFGRLEANETAKMWRMLMQKNQGDLQISYKDLTADEMQGSAKWRAVYKFGHKRRKVINKIVSNFKFEDNKIIEQHDDFDLWLWSKQAFGWKGWLFGWSADFKSKLRERSRTMLEKYVPTDKDELEEAI